MSAHCQSHEDLKARTEGSGNDFVIASFFPQLLAELRPERMNPRC